MLRRLAEYAKCSICPVKTASVRLSEGRVKYPVFVDSKDVLAHFALNAVKLCTVSRPPNFELALSKLSHRLRLLEECDVEDHGKDGLFVLRNFSDAYGLVSVALENVPEVLSWESPPKMPDMFERRPSTISLKLLKHRTAFTMYAEASGITADLLRCMGECKILATEKRR